MRIQGLINYKSKNYKNFNNNKTKYINKNSLAQLPHNHKYSGVVSADLAYVSMFDNKIAQELKTMGLI